LHHFISHQTTPRAVEKGALLIGESFGHPEIVRSISHTGNTASTTHAAVLESLLEDGQLAPDQKIYFMSFGSGLAMIGMNFHLPHEVETW
ncbi:MAG TPA: hypothetical protein D7I11_01520, partial [Candidatus Poseidoniales archaeon]